jgi:hypothetical protein
MVLQSRLLILFKPKISFYPFNGLILLCIAFYRRTIQNYPIKAVKIGIVPSLAYLQEIVLALKGFRQKTSIVWDTVLKSSTEYDFLNIENQTF